MRDLMNVSEDPFQPLTHLDRIYWYELASVYLIHMCHFYSLFIFRLAKFQAFHCVTPLTHKRSRRTRRNSKKEREREEKIASQFRARFHFFAVGYLPFNEQTGKFRLNSHVNIKR